MKKITKKFLMDVLENISKKTSLRIVGSTVLRKHQLISREAKDIDVVVTSKDDMEEVMKVLAAIGGERKSEVVLRWSKIPEHLLFKNYEDLTPSMLMSFGEERTPEELGEMDEWKETWEEVRYADWILVGGIKVDFSVTEKLPEEDSKNPLYCSKEAAVSHKKKIALRKVGSRNKDFLDYLEILKISEESRKNLNTFFDAKKRVSDFFPSQKKFWEKFQEEYKKSFFFRFHDIYGEEEAFASLKSFLQSKHYPESFINDVSFLIKFSGKIIPEIEW